MASAAVLGGAPASALASSSVDMRGTWSVGGEYAQTETITAMNMESGAFSGTGAAENKTGFTWPTHGVVSGFNVTWVFGPYEQVNYTATCTGTLAGDGNSVSGQCEDTHGVKGAPGSWVLTRTSGPGGLRGAAMQVSCSAFEPGLFGEYFQCTAQMGDASGKSPQATPTGSVAFSIDKGGGGGFPGASSCTLVPSSTGGASSYCSVNYRPLLPGFVPIGSQPPLTATYSGDATFEHISAHPKGAIGSENPLSTEAALKALCGVAYMPGCEGPVSLPPGLAEACASLEAHGGGASACGGGAGSGGSPETVTVEPGEGTLVAEASCPAKIPAPLTSCEWETYLGGGKDPDPALRERVQYELNYNAYVTELNRERASVLGELQGVLRDNAKGPGDFTEVTMNAVNVVWTQALNKIYDEAAVRGSRRELKVEFPDKWCGGEEDCLKFVASANQSVNESLQNLRNRSYELGLVPKPKAKSSRAGGSARRRTMTRVPKRRGFQAILGQSALVTAKPGERAKIRILLSPLAREKLSAARHRHLHTLRGVLEVHVYLAAGRQATDNAVRVIPVTLRLVSKRARARAR